MYDENFTVQTTADRVYRRFYNPAINDSVKDWANDQLQAIQSDLDMVLSFDEGYREFLIDYIPREVERYHAESVDDIPHDELRETPICTCDDLGCRLKAGRLPHDVVEADTIDDGMKQFKQVHRGSPEVLVDAAEAWRQKRTDVWTVLRYIEAHLVEEQEEPPEATADQIIANGPLSATATDAAAD